MAATKPAFTPPGKKGDMIFSALVKLAALIVLLMLGGIIVSLIISSWPSIQKFGFAFLWTKEWDAPNEIFGALVPIYGTLVTSFIALLIAVPVSFGIALFLTELSPAWLKRPLGIAIELLAAIPSIVYGMWGLFIFAPLFATYFQEPVGNVLSTIPFVGALFAGPAFGIGILAAGVILAIMIIPYIAAVRTIKVITNRIRPSSISAATCRPVSASANSLASAEVILFPGIYNEMLSSW